MRKLLSFALVLLMIVPLCMFPASAAYTADRSWYNATATEFVLTTPQQLLGLASISGVLDDFNGKTIKLGADIEFNTGKAADWAETAPANVWKPIANFAGTFDGQGHTVSGLYMKGDGAVGFFDSITTKALVKNLSVVNSYFYTTGYIAAGVIAKGTGTVSNVYSDAIVHADGYHAGGIVAYCTADITVDSCWFAGQVSVGVRYAAGIVGNCMGKNVTIKHCLNSGLVFGDQQEMANLTHIGGMVGRQDAGKCIIEDSLNVGRIQSKYDDDGFYDEIGSMVGAVRHADGGVYLTNCWATAESCSNIIGGNMSTKTDQTQDCNLVLDDLLNGYGAYINTTLDFENYWAVNLDGYPIPQGLYKGEMPKLYDLTTPSVNEAELKLEGNYGPKWTVTLKIPEGMDKDDITLGALIAPTKIIPEGLTMHLQAESFNYRGEDWPVANVEAKVYRESDAGTLVATFVITDMDDETARMNFTILPYAIFKTEDGPIEIYGKQTDFTFYKEAALAAQSSSTSAADKAKIEAVLAPIDEKIGAKFPVREDWSEVAEFEQVPAFMAGDKLSQAIDYGVNNWRIEITGTSDDDYFAYLELLEEVGFKEVYNNGELGINDTVYTHMYQKGDLTVTVIDIAYKNQVYITAAYDEPLSEHLFDNFKSEAVAGAKNELHLVETYWFGNSIIIKLKNGHYIINDGGTEQELGYLLDYLEEITPGDAKPVVEAWICSHFHRDHIDNMFLFLRNPANVDRIYVEGLYANIPGEFVVSQYAGIQAEIDMFRMMTGVLKTTDGGHPEIYRMQTGQRYFFCDVSMEVLLTQEQIDPSTYTNEFNDTSTWVQFYLDGQNVSIPGDSSRVNMQWLMDVYEKDFLDFDVFVTPHHDENTWTTFNNYCKYKTVLHANLGYPSDRLTASLALDAKAVAAGGEWMSNTEGTVVMSFPYTVGSYKRLPKTDWIYHVGKTRPLYAADPVDRNHVNIIK